MNTRSRVTRATPGKVLAKTPSIDWIL